MGKFPGLFGGRGDREVFYGGLNPLVAFGYEHDGDVLADGVFAPTLVTD